MVVGRYRPEKRKNPGNTFTPIAITTSDDENSSLDPGIPGLNLPINNGCLVGKFYSTDCELDGDAKGAWSEACEDLRRKKKSHQTAFEFDEVLFKLSRNGCSHIDVNGECPKREECKLYPKYCVTANPKSKIDLCNPIQIDSTFPSLNMNFSRRSRLQTNA